MSAFEFRYRGGISKPRDHANEKFLLFFLVGNQELPVYQLRKDGLITQPSSAESDLFTVPFEICKVFLYSMEFGKARQMHSFYIRLTNDLVPQLIVRPFSGMGEFYFKAKGKLLKKEDVLALLPDDCESKRYAKNQTIPPLDVLRRILSVDRTVEMEDVRKVRILGK